MDIEQNFNRLFQQKEGDKALLLLGIYSFIEGYIRDELPKYKFENCTEKEKQIHFPGLLLQLWIKRTKKTRESLINKYKKETNLERLPEETMNCIYKEIEKLNPDLHNLLFNQIRYFYQEFANPVRHTFLCVEQNTLDTAITQFIKFAQFEKFYKPELENLSDFTEWKNRTPPPKKQQLIELQQQLKDLEEKYAAKDEAFFETLNKLQEMENEKERLQDSLLKLESQKEKLNKRFNELRKKRFDLIEKIKELEQRNTQDPATQRELQALNEELNSIKQEKEEQETLLEQKQQEIDSLKQSNMSLAEKNKELLSEKNTLEKRNTKLDNEAKSIKSQIILLNEDKEKNQEKIQKLQASYECIINLKEQQENQLLEKQAELDKLNQSYENLSLMSQELAKEKGEIENKLKESIDEANELRSQINTLERTPILSPEQEENLKKQQERYTNLKKVVENLRKQRNEIQKEHQAQVEALQKDAETYLKNTNILQAYTSAARNYHARILKLSPEQEQIVDAIFEELSKLNNADSPEDFLLTGGPGTGKTFVLIKLLEKIATEKLNKNVKLLTYTDSLNKYNQYLSQEYEKKNPETTEHVTNFMKENIQTFDSYFIPKMEAILGKSIYIFNLKNEKKKESAKYKKIHSIFENLAQENTDKIMEEAFNEIWTFSPTKEGYITKSFLGDNITLSEEVKKTRERIWDIVESAELQIEKESSIPSDYAYYKISSEEKYKHLSEIDKIDFLLIDEIQDLSPAKIRVVSKLNKLSCVMAGDLNQSVFIKRALSWGGLVEKLSTTHYTHHTLKKNYRSTINIQKLANKYREMCDIKDDDSISESFIPGQDPELSISENLEDALSKILRKIQCYINILNFNPRDICIVVPSNEELIRMRGLLHDHQLKAMAMVDPKFDFAKKNIIRLSTTKQVKGIDSPIVILLLTENFTDEQKNGDTDSMTQMNSIYSCITRTMDLLYVQITKAALSSNLEENGENAITKLKKIWNK